MYLVALALLLRSAQAEERNPMPRILGLLTKLKETVEADGAGEQKLYDEFACWCQDTTEEKSAAIKEAQNRIGELTQSIQELQALTASTGVEVTKLTKDEADAKESLSKAETLRAKDVDAYNTRKSELETGIANLARAIKVLAEGTGTSAEQETKLLTVAAGVRQAMHMLKKDEKASSSAKEVRTFLANPAAWVQTGATRPGEEYNHQSGAIQGILKDMHDTFKRDLTKANEDEATAKTNYDALFATSTKNIEILGKTLTKKTADNGSAASQLSADELERHDTERQLDKDTDVLETATTTCKARANEWSERSMLRQEELLGMNKAIAILSAGAETFANATKSEDSFMQVSMSTLALHRAKPDPRATAAYQELAKLAEARPQLAVVAAAVRTSTTGHFDGVMGLIDRMLQDLSQESADDEAHKKWCNAERANAQNKVNAMDYDSDDLGAKMERMDAKKTELETSINTTNDNIKDLKDHMKTMLDNRVAENAAFTQAKKDDTESIRLLTDAIKVLGQFAANHAELLQRSDPPPVWGDTGGGGFKGRSSESKGILGILGMIKDDFIKEAMEGSQEEEFNAANYRKLRKEAEADMESLEREKDALNGELAHTMQVLSSATALQGDTNTTREATEAYLVELKPNCDWVELTYANRVSARASEVTGLQNAKAILSGAELPEEGLLSTQASVAQTAPLSVSAELAALNAAPRTFLRH
jgi:hypothetical protein